MKDFEKEFKPSSWSIDNKTSIYVITIIITLAGFLSFNSIPKEQFPEVVFPQILITTVRPGTSPTDMENTVTKPIEKRMKSIAGVKKVTSNSKQNFSMITVEFNTDVQIPIAKQKVKDEVDKARNDLPNDLPQEPTVMDIDISQMPIMNVNISGDFPLDKLKKYADDLKDKIEGLKEITRVDLIGALDREIQVNLDIYKMEAANVSLGDVERAVNSENLTISGGEAKMDGVKRSINIRGEFKSAANVGDMIIRSQTGATIFLKDIADVKDAFKQQESFARLDHKNVITLNVIKRSGANLIDASDKIRVISDEMSKNNFPKELKVTITGDQSTKTRVTVHDLINTIIIGFLLVTLILMFFMGATNAIFVAMSVPLSTFVAFVAMPALGGIFDFSFTLNMIVLFSLLLALGIVVDDAIVVIENTHRIFNNGKVPIKKAAKIAAGEVFLPVLSGTLTTLAPFVPLMFWQGVIGKFMFFLPTTLIVTLSASLVVAYIINPVFAVSFMKTHEEEEAKHKNTKLYKIVAVVFAALALLFYGFKNWGMGNFVLTVFAFYSLNRFVLHDLIKKFQEKTWPSVQDNYKKMMNWVFQGRRPMWTLLGTLGLFIFSIVLLMIRSPKVDFFPKADPNFVYTYIALPVGTDQNYTDSITRIVEKKIYNVVGENNPIVESVISNIALGAGNPREFDNSVNSHLAKVTVAFVEFGKRKGQSTLEYLDKIRKEVKGIPGAEIVVEQEQGGPPTGKAITIEVLGDDFDQLARNSKKLKLFLDSLQIPGVEELKSDLQDNNPELIIDIDRERANREGISTGQIGMELRKAVFGLDKTSKLRDADDEYPIQVRLKENQRNDIEALMNLKISFRDMNMGGVLRQVPLSSVAKFKYSSTYGGIKRKNQTRIVTISSNVLSGFNGNEVVPKVKKAVAQFGLPDGITVNMAGEQEDQAETGAFLGRAMLISLGLIFIILVTQFNSISKPIIILSEIVLSIIGVFLGFAITKMNFSVIMTGVGIIALAGIVVRNGILLVEFTEILLKQGIPLKEAIIDAGRTRMTPVILTASATILGLIPLAVGLNMDFVTLFSELNPHIHFGGDNVAFWGPLSWTMIFGLSFATILTLVLVPVMLYLTEKLKLKWGIKPKH